MTVIEHLPSVVPVGGSISMGKRGNRTVVSLDGEFDLATAAAVADAMARAVALDEEDVVVDLSNVQFLDTTTLDILVRTREFLRLRSRSLSMDAPSPRAHRLLTLCGISELDDARADLRGGP